MVATHKREEVRGTAWLSAVLDLLWGGAVGAAVALGVTGLAAVLIWAGALSAGAGDRAVLVGCLLGGFLGGAFALRKGRGGALPMGLGAGGVLLLVLLTAGVLVWRVPPELSAVGLTAGGCLCGGALAGVLFKKTKKKRRK